MSKGPIKGDKRRRSTVKSSEKLGKGRKSVFMTAVDGEDSDDDEWLPLVKDMMKSDEPLQLTDAQLKEEIGVVLTGINPQAPISTVQFSYKDMCFKPNTDIEHLIVHLNIPAKLLHKSSEEAQRQMAQQETSGEELTVTPGKSQKKLKNKFNFCDRAAQTYNNPFREKEIQTIPPPRKTLAGSVSQWEIYDAYVQHAERLAKQQEKPKPAAPPKKSKKEKKVGDSQVDELAQLSNAVNTLDRMVNQNIFDEISQDFKYFDDASDDYRDQQGTLLPLWKFFHEQAKTLQVTSLTWSPKYKDIFFASFGSYDYLKQQHGMICVFSLKNPSYPEFLYVLDSGIMHVDTHPSYPFYIAAGYYDGSVAVFSLKETEKTPKYMSDPKKGKHNDPVWQVKWQKNNLDGHLNFASVSSDGRITNWVLHKTELIPSDMIHLKLDKEPLEGPDGTQLDIKSCGTAFAFHSQIDSLFLIGTEEGVIYQCSKIYTSRYLMTYEAHTMTVHCIQWNLYHPDVFISCSADWTVRIWDYKDPKPLFTYDLGCPVGDVAWAPHSATVFAAAAANGKVFVYDLNINKHRPVCEQIVVQKKNRKLTTIAFNTHYPVLVAGDNRGTIICLKLSPNLRKAIKDNQKLDAAGYIQAEINKMNKILSVVRDKY